MNTFEKIKNASEEQLSDMFCSLIEAAASRTDVNSVCDICPVSEQCRKGQAGFYSWLNESGRMDFKSLILNT